MVRVSATKLHGSFVQGRNDLDRTSLASSQQLLSPSSAAEPSI